MEKDNRIGNADLSRLGAVVQDTIRNAQKQRDERRKNRSTHLTDVPHSGKATQSYISTLQGEKLGGPLEILNAEDIFRNNQRPLFEGWLDNKASDPCSSCCNDGAGADGATGATGPSGVDGDPGATGATGPEGRDGQNGATGASGPVGPPGPGSGSTGATGTAGPPGVAGATGPSGLPGPAGDDGATGASGVGTTGATGPAGPAGIGLRGATGATGELGPIGATGPGGGEQGVTGASGIAGPPGATGAQGDSGPIGSSGIQGPPGDTGVAGPAGATGVGATGATGPAGPTGQIGASGVGSTGASGSSGPAGPGGATGPQGATGSVGATGSGGSDVFQNRTIFIDVKYGTSPGVVENYTKTVASFADALALIAADPVPPTLADPWKLQVAPGNYIIGDMVLPRNVVIQGTPYGATRLIGTISVGPLPLSVPAQISDRGGLVDVTLFKEYTDRASLTTIKPITLTPEMRGYFFTSRCIFDIQYSAPALQDQAEPVKQNIVSIFDGVHYSVDCIYNLVTATSYLPEPFLGADNIDCVWDTVPNAALPFQPNRYIGSFGDQFIILTHSRYRDANFPRICLSYIRQSAADSAFAMLKGFVTFRIENLGRTETQLSPVNCVVIFHDNLPVSEANQAVSNLSDTNVLFFSGTNYSDVNPINTDNNVLALGWNLSPRSSMTFANVSVTAQQQQRSNNSVGFRKVIYMCNQLPGISSGPFASGPAVNLMNCSWVAPSLYLDATGTNANTDVTPWIKPAALRTTIPGGPGERGNRLRYFTINNTGTINGSGGLALNAVLFDTSVVTAYVSSDQDSSIFVDATTASGTIQLPQCQVIPANYPTVLPGRIITIRRIGGGPGNTVTILPTGANTIDPGVVGAITLIPGQARTFQTMGDGSWYTIAQAFV